jgi:hypothetical protein
MARPPPTLHSLIASCHLPLPLTSTAPLLPLTPCQPDGPCPHPPSQVRAAQSLLSAPLPPVSSLLSQPDALARLLLEAISGRLVQNKHGVKALLQATLLHAQRPGETTPVGTGAGGKELGWEGAGCLGTGEMDQGRTIRQGCDRGGEAAELERGGDGVQDALRQKGGGGAGKEGAG